MELEQYLKERIAPSTAKRYLREIELFFLSTEEKNIDPATATYQQIMDYLGELRQQSKSKKSSTDRSRSVNCSLHGIKKYYSFLITTGERKDHPCRYIKLRDKSSRDIQLQDLFKPTELEQLLEKKERYKHLKNRNKIIISLFIYQGLTNREVTNLQLDAINLEQGTVRILPGRKTNARTLKLQSKQVFWIMSYIQNDRSKLLQGEKSNHLIISNIGGLPITGEGICALIDTLKYLFPTRKLNAKTIRQSVITNLLKEGKDLRIVQAFAGHKYPSTTEKYKQTQVEELKNQILKYHPLK